MANFQKLGQDRLQQNIQRAFGNAPTGVVTGDITRGEVVEVVIGNPTTNETSGTVQVKSRRTGAIPLGYFTEGGDSIVEMQWYVQDDTLSLNVEAATYGTFFFWVF